MEFTEKDTCQKVEEKDDSEKHFLKNDESLCVGFEDTLSVDSGYDVHPVYWDEYSTKGSDLDSLDIEYFQDDSEMMKTCDEILEEKLNHELEEFQRDKLNQELEEFQRERLREKTGSDSSSYIDNSSLAPIMQRIIAEDIERDKNMKEDIAECIKLSEQLNIQVVLDLSYKDRELHADDAMDIFEPEEIYDNQNWIELSDTNRPMRNPPGIRSSSNVRLDQFKNDQANDDEELSVKESNLSNNTVYGPDLSKYKNLSDYDGLAINWSEFSRMSITERNKIIHNYVEYEMPNDINNDLRDYADIKNSEAPLREPGVYSSMERFIALRKEAWYKGKEVDPLRPHSDVEKVFYENETAKPEVKPKKKNRFMQWIIGDKIDEIKESAEGTGRSLVKELVNELKEEKASFVQDIKELVNSFLKNVCSPSAIDKVIGLCITIFNFFKVPSTFLRITIVMQYIVSIGIFSVGKLLSCFSQYFVHLNEFLDIVIKHGTNFFKFISEKMLSGIASFFTLIASYFICSEEKDHEEVVEQVVDKLVPQGKIEFSLDYWCRKMSSLKNGMRGVEYIKNLFWYVFSWTYNKIRGEPFYTDENQVWIKNAIEFVKKVNNLMNDVMVCGRDNVLVHREFCSLILLYHSEGLDIAADLMKIGYTKSNFASFFRALDFLKNTSPDAQRFLETADSRFEPLYMMFVGEPAVGKTNVCKFLFHDIWDYMTKYQMKVDPEEAAWNENYVYVRNVRDPFWSNFLGSTKFVLMDDAFQIDDIKLRTATLEDIVHCVNTATFLLNDPVAENKGHTKFDAIALFVTQNTNNLGSVATPKSQLQNKFSAHGRRDYYLKVRTVARHKNPHPVSARDMVKLGEFTESEVKFYGADKDTGFSRAAYEFIPHDVLSEKPLLGSDGQEIVWDYAEVLTRALQRILFKRSPKKSLSTYIANNKINFDAMFQGKQLVPQMGRSKYAKKEIVVTEHIPKKNENKEEKENLTEEEKIKWKAFADANYKAYINGNDVRLMDYFILPDGVTVDAKAYILQMYIKFLMETVGVKQDEVDDMLKNPSNYEKIRKRAFDTANTGILGRLKNELINFVNRHAVLTGVLAWLSGFTIGYTVIWTLIKVYRLFKDDFIPHFDTGGSSGTFVTTKNQAPVVNERNFRLVPNGGNEIDLLLAMNKKNRIIMRTYVESGDFMRMKCWALTENIIVMPKHYVDFLWEKGADVTFSNGREPQILKPKGDGYDVIKDELNDIAFIRVPSWQYFHDVKDLFVKDSDLLNTNLSDITYYKISGKDEIDKPPVIMEIQKAYRAPPATYAADEKSPAYFSKGGLEYEGNFTVGDCGNLVAVNNNNMPRKLLGIHTAGTASGRIGRASFITQDGINLVKDMFKRKNSLLPQVEVVIKETPEYNYKHWEYIGSVDDKIKTNFPRKSKIVETPWQELLGPVVKKPAKLRPFKNNKGEEISPLQKAITKLEQDESPPIDEKLCDRIGEHWILSIPSHYPAHVLNEDETLNGALSARYIKPVDGKTSAGYTEFPQSFQKKEDLFNRDYETSKWSMGDYLRAKYHYILKEYKLKRNKKIITIIHMKDELRDLKRVSEGKTRLFGCPETVNMIIMKQYYGAFVENVGLSAIRNGIAFGIDPGSPDWSAIRSHLESILAVKEFDGDSSTHDGRCHKYLVDLFIRLVNKWYKQNDKDWKGEDDVIREMVFRDVSYDATLLIGSDLLRVKRYLASGCWLTYVFQSFSSQIIHRYCLAKAGDENGKIVTIKDLFTETMLEAGGDDYLQTLTEYFDWYTFTMFQEQVRKIGYEYTPPDKETETYTHRAVRDVEFLKRLFVERDGIITAPLDISNVLNIMNWRQDGVPLETSFQQSAMSTLFELWHIGKKEFEVAYDSINHYAVAHGYEPIHYDWNMMQAHYGLIQFIVSKFENRKMMFDSGIKNGDKLINVDYLVPQMEVVPNAQGSMTVNGLTAIDDTLVPEIETTVHRDFVFKNADPYPSQQLETTLGREYQIDEFVFDGAATNGTLVKVYQPIYDLIQSQNYLYQIISRYRFFKYDHIEISFRINSTKFHYGMLLVAHIPYNGSLSTALPNKLKQLFVASTCNPLIIDASIPKTVKKCIAYRAPSQFIDTSRFNVRTGDGGTIAIYVLNELNLTNAPSTPTVGVTVFARFVNPQVAGPIALNTFMMDKNAKNKLKELPENVKDGKKEETVRNFQLIPHGGPSKNGPKSEQIEKSEEGLISGIAEATGDLATKISKIPILPPMVSEGLAIGGTIAKGIGSIAKSLGFTKPVSMESTQNVQLNTFSGMATGDGLFSGYELGLEEGGEIVTDPECFQVKELETQISEVFIKPGLVQQFSFDATDASSTVINRHYVTGSSCYTTINSGGTIITGQHTPMSLIASLYRYQRPILKIFVQLICSLMMSGRLRISWFAKPTDAPAIGAMMIEGSGDIYSEIIEFNGTSTFCFSIPYLSDFPYIRVTDPNIKNADSTNGVVVYSIVNPVVAMDTTASTTVQANVWMALDEESQFLVLADRPGGATNNRSYSQVTSFQTVLIPQGGVEADMNDIDAIFKKKFPALANAVGTKYHRLTVPEEQTSIYKILHKPVGVPSVARKFTNLLPVTNTAGGSVLNPINGETSSMIPWNAFSQYFMYLKTGFYHFITPQVTTGIDTLIVGLLQVDNAGVIFRPNQFGASDPSFWTGNTPFIFQKTQDHDGIMVHQPYRSLLPYSSRTDQSTTSLFANYGTEELLAVWFTGSATDGAPLYWWFCPDDTCRMSGLFGPPGFTIS